MDSTTAPLASIDIDIGKEVFHIVGFGTNGKIAFRRKIKRLALVDISLQVAKLIWTPTTRYSSRFLRATLSACGATARASARSSKLFAAIPNRLFLQNRDEAVEIELFPSLDMTAK